MSRRVPPAAVALVVVVSALAAVALAVAMAVVSPAHVPAAALVAAVLGASGIRTAHGLGDSDAALTRSRARLLEAVR